MDAEKRAWIWAGIAVAAGVGLVALLDEAPRPSTRRVLLAGDSLAEGLRVPMKTLAESSGMLFRSASTRSASACPEALTAAMKQFRPDLVLICVGADKALLAEPPLVAELCRIAMADGAHVVWVGAPGADPAALAMIRKAAPSIFPTEALDLPRGPDAFHPTAKGYAGWAGAIWRWLGRPEAA